jgi:hypothetical protein
MFLVAYMQTRQARQAVDQANDILKDRPKDYPSLYATVSMVTQLKPATPADLDTAEKNANLFMDNLDSIKPAAITDAQWTATKTQFQFKPLAEQQLIAIYDLRKDDKREVTDLTKLLQKDPTLAVASYKLGQTMMKIFKAENTPEKAPPALYQIARAIAYDGPGALPAANKPAIQTYLGNAYTAFHGSAEGLDKLLATAKTNAFPPADFSIKSTVDIAKDQEAARQAEIAKDPIMYMWTHTIKDGLATKGESFWEDSVKDAGLPGPDPNDKSDPPVQRFYKAKIISMTPNPKPKELVVGIEKGDVADAKIVFFDKKEALEGTMEVGSEIEFWGAAKDWSHDPKNVVVTFEVADPKTDLKGWTGKNPPTNAKGRGPAGAKGTPPAAGKQAPKQ